MTPRAVRRMVGDWRLSPGRRAVVVAPAAEETAVLLREAGTEVVAAVDPGVGTPPALEATARRGSLAAVTVDGTRHECDLLVVSAGLQPAYSLASQAGGKVRYDAGRGIFVPVELPDGVEVVGAAAGERVGAVPPRAGDAKGR